MAPQYTEGEKKLQGLLASRVTTRNFKSDPIPDDVLSDILRITLRAPTAYNVQPYACILARAQEDRERLAEGMFSFNTDKVKQAPLVAVFAADLEPSRLLPRTQEIMLESGYPQAFVDTLPGAVYESCGDGMPSDTPRISTVSTAAWSYKNATFAAATFLYAATAHGLATCICEGFDEAKVKEVMEIPDRYSVPLVVVVGYPAPEPTHGNTRRFKMEELVFDGKFGVTDLKLEKN